MFLFLACQAPATGGTGEVPGVDAVETGDTGETGVTGETGNTSDTGDTATAEDDEVTVLSLNLHCFKLDGTSFASNDDRFDAIATTAAAEGVDAFAVQEACVNDAEGSAMDRLAAALGAATGVSWGSAWQPTHMAWEGTADEAQEGVGLLARGGDPADVATLDYAVQGTQARWAVAGTVTSASGASSRLYSVHLDHDDAGARLMQARQTAMHALVNAPASWGTLVAGDWNALATDDALADLALAGFTRLSSDSDPEGTQIDHVLAPLPAGYEVFESRLLFAGTDAVSDHPGVLVRLRLGTPASAAATRFAATYDTGVDHYLALRGDVAPLDWTEGWPAANTASGRWEAVFLGWASGTVAYKWTYDDAGWETGDNHAVAAGDAADVTPEF